MPAMSPFEIEQVLAKTTLIGLVWVFAFLAPAYIALPVKRPDGELWLLIGAIFVYYGYFGFRKWQGGLRAPLVLRVVVPILLFVLSYLLLLVGVWQKVLEHIRLP